MDPPREADSASDLPEVRLQILITTQEIDGNLPAEVRYIIMLGPEVLIGFGVRDPCDGMHEFFE
jgi:hypothetical protein